MNPDPEFVEQLTREIMEKVNRELRQMTLVPGTVTDTGPTSNFRGAWAFVQIDGDEEGEALEVPIGVGVGLEEGDRVLVLQVPPHGGFVIGVTEGPSVPCRVANFAISGLADTASGADPSRFVLTEHAADTLAAYSLACGFYLDDLDGDGQLDSVVFTERGVYSASGGVAWEQADDGEAMMIDLMLQTRWNESEANAGLQAIGGDRKQYTAGLYPFPDNVWTNTHEPSFFADVGDSLYLRGWRNGSAIVDVNADTTSSLKVVQHCCEFVPGTPEPDPTTT